MKPKGTDRTTINWKKWEELKDRLFLVETEQAKVNWENYMKVLRESDNEPFYSSILGGSESEGGLDGD